MEDEYKFQSPDQWRQCIRDFVELGGPLSGAPARRAALIQLLNADSTIPHHSYELNAQDLIQHEPRAAVMILRHPDALMELCNDGLVEAQVLCDRRSKKKSINQSIH